MHQNWRLLFSAALLSTAVGAVVVSPLFGQGRPRGPGSATGEYQRSGSPGGDRRGPRSSMGEYRRPGPPGGDRRGSNPSRGEYRRSGSPGGDRRGSSEDEVRRYDRFLGYLDSNGDGRIDENEVDGRRRYFAERIFERAGIPAKFPISIKKLREGLQKQAQQAGGASGDKESSADSAQEPLVPGFGVEMDPSPVLKFGEAAPSGSSSRATGSSSRSTSDRSSSSSSNNEGDDRIRRWAEAMIRQNDKNKNGRLEKDEWKDMRGDPQRNDRNNDGVITLDEMTAGLREYSRGGSRGRGSSTGDSSRSRGGRSDSDNSDGRKSYRFIKATERLPDGLPDWFLEKDANEDGQVAMVEYSSYWTDAKAIEFTRYDANNDGLITPTECLETEERAEDAEGSRAEKKDAERTVKTENREGAWAGF